MKELTWFTLRPADSGLWLWLRHAWRYVRVGFTPTPIGELTFDGFTGIQPERVVIYWGSLDDQRWSWGDLERSPGSRLGLRTVGLDGGLGIPVAGSRATGTFKALTERAPMMREVRRTFENMMIKSVVRENR